MSFVPSAMTSSEDRPVPLRLRPDVRISESEFQGEKSWVVKDPISLKYHRLQEAEITVLNMLDGEVSLREIRTALQKKYPTKRVRLGDIQMLLGSMHRAGLVLAEAPGQGWQLLDRERESRRQKIIQQVSSILWMRFPGFDPEPSLNWLYPRVGFLFRRWFLYVWIALVIAACSLLLVNYQEFTAKLPDMGQFFTGSNFFLLIVVVGVTKMMHEFGHGLACKHFGGECHSIGFMLLLFTPALYCETSDSWTVRNRWHRAAVGAAGMYIEVLLASMATFVWWFTSPGAIHYMALNVMFVCSVSTVIFNSNPLLRYDGYYILSDVLEIPNLAQKSRLALANFARTVCLGLPPASARQLPERNQAMFALYSVLSFAYRWVVLTSILWLLFTMFRPRGLEAIGHVMIASSLVGMVFMPLWQMGKYFAMPGRMQQIKTPRLIASTIVVACLAAAAFFIPWPHHIGVPVVARPEQAGRVYVTTPGMLERIFAGPGATVEAGQPIAQLKEPNLELRVAEIRGLLEMERERLAGLIRQQTVNPKAADQIPSSQARIRDFERRADELQKQQQRLTLTASKAGQVIPAPEIPEPIWDDDGQLPGWSGEALEPKNLGSFLQAGTMVCLIGRPDEMKALLLIDRSDMEMVHTGQPVEILWDEYRSHRLQGTIRDIAKRSVIIPPRELSASAGGPLPTQPDSSGGERPLVQYYEASVPLENLPMRILPGFRGQAKIRVANKTLVQRLTRLLNNLFQLS